MGYNGIMESLNLEELDAEDNPLITTLNHLQKLRRLNIGGNSGVNNNGIQGCINLNDLCAWNNPGITK